MSLHTKAQTDINIFKAEKIRTINSKDEDYNDLQFLKKVLQDKKIVLLGEQSHGDGATFEAKVRLIKFLHKEMGFELLAFESNMYDNFITNSKVNALNSKNSPLKESIYQMWSESKELEELINYTHKQSQSDTPLLITGFDSQNDDLFKEQYISDVRKQFENSGIHIEPQSFQVLEQVISGDIENIATNSKDSAEFESVKNEVAAGFNKLIKIAPSKLNSILEQTYKGWLANVQWEIDDFLEKIIKVQNPRDEQMAKNLIFLSTLYPEKKIICWGASYHFANKIELIEHTELTKQFVHNMDSVQKNRDPTDLTKDLDGAVPMGKLLKTHFNDELFSISFSSYEGAFGMLGFDSTSLASITPPKGSIEEYLTKNNYPIGFVNYDSISTGSFYTSSLGNIPIYAPWKKIFDGHFFIKTSYPPSFPVTVSEPSINISAYRNPKISSDQYFNVKGKIIDAKTKEGIGYVNISIINSNKGTSANSDGLFDFNFSEKKLSAKIIFSSVGYQTDTLTLQQLKKNIVVELVPRSYLLSDIVVRSKLLTAKEIIRRAEKKIGDNYLQQPHNQEVFYRTKYLANDTVTFKEEASILLLNTTGYQSGLNQKKNIKGEILQLKKAVGYHSDIWGGIGSLWLIYSHDVILDKANVLHRVAHHDVSLSGVTEYDGQKVYIINFKCKKPGSYTVGIGYPSPESAEGFIYIDMENYAVLKFECTMYRKPYKYRRHPGITNYPSCYQLTQTYKKTNGKYHLNYSRMLTIYKDVDIIKNTSSKYVRIFELLSTNVSTDNLILMYKSIMKLKVGYQPKYDEKFWGVHNYFVEDDLKSYDKLLIGK